MRGSPETDQFPTIAARRLRDNRHMATLGFIEYADAGPAGSRRRLDDVTGGGWVLLGYLADPAGDLPAELARWWAGIGGRCFQLTPDGPLQDSTGAYGRWFATLDGEKCARQREQLFAEAVRQQAVAADA